VAASGISGLNLRELAGDSRWTAIGKVAESSQFVRAPLLRDFLFYIAGQELSGHPEEITEQKIGHRVYKRNELYNPADDNIVRVSAHQLRLKLREYYETEGREDEWIVEIPKGRYIPLFRKRVELEEERSKKSPSRFHRAAFWLLPVAAGAFFLGFAMARYFSPALSATHPPNPAPNLITSIFQNAAEPVQVIMSDEALILLESLSRRRFTLEEYANQNYRQLPPAFQENQSAIHFWHVLEQRQIVNVGDAGIGMRIRDSFAALDPSPLVQVRSAQNMRPRDFLSGNFILLGASNSDPWVQMFSEGQFNFQFEEDAPDRPVRIRNLHPKPGESDVYMADATQHLSYARIEYFPNISRSGHVLMIAGTSMEGTEAAADFCLQPDSVAALRRALGIGGSAPFPAFEILLAASSAAGAGVNAQVLSVRAERPDVQ
jgi:hypothetical protein